MKNYKYTYTCKFCKKIEKTCQPQKRICSDECRRKLFNSRYGRSSENNLPTLTIAAMSELMAAHDLMEKGYTVFRNVSQASFCDLVAIRGKKILQVEVRTGYRGANGKLTFPRLLRKTANCYAICSQKEKNIYFFNKKLEEIKV